MGYLGVRRLTRFLGAALLFVPIGAPQQRVRERSPAPSWAAGVPDTVWILVEASYAPENPDTVKSWLRAAEDLARALVERDENDVGARLGLAAVLGRRANVEGGRTRVRAASALRDELGVILDLDPGQAQAHHLLGRLYAGVRRMGGVTRWIATNLLGGSALKEATWEAAEEHLRFAEQARGEISDYHLQLANLYRDTGRPALALSEVHHVLDLSADTPRELEILEEGRRLEAYLLERLPGASDTGRVSIGARRS